MFFRNLLLVTSLVFLLSVSSGQEFSGGIITGITASQIDGDSHAGYSKIGGMVGGFISRPINDIFRAQLEMRFIQKGANNKATGDVLKLNYIDFPLLLQHKKWNILFSGGIAPAILVDAKVESDYSGEYDFEGYSRFATDATFGIYYQVFEKLGTEARFAYSILPLTSMSNKYGTRGQYSNMLQFSFVYQFNN